MGRNFYPAVVKCSVTCATGPEGIAGTVVRWTRDIAPAKTRAPCLRAWLAFLHTNKPSTPKPPFLRRVVAATERARSSNLGSDVRWQWAGFGLNIRRLSTRLPRRTRLIDLRFKISRFLNQNGSKLRVVGCPGELEKRRRLTHEIIPAYHAGSPSTTQRRTLQSEIG